MMVKGLGKQAGHRLWETAITEIYPAGTNGANSKWLYCRSG